MKYIFSILLFVIGFSSASFAQTEKVKWDAKTEKINQDTYKIVLTADVEDGWYIYSQYMESGGPVPTAIQFEGKGFTVDGSTEEYGEIAKEFFDPVFELDIKKYGGEVSFSQIVKSTTSAPKMSAFVTFMSCDDQMCLPPKQIEIPIYFN